MLKKGTRRTNFEDNRQRFRLLNGLQKQPSKPMFFTLSLVSIALSIVPLVYPGAFYSTTSWLFYALGLALSIGFEQAANIHYVCFSKIANAKAVDKIKLHINLNKGLRSLAMMMWLLSGVAIALMVVSKSDSLSTIW